eukprot:12910600-Prorocentrum_lima.AAC.1
MPSRQHAANMLKYILGTVLPTKFQSIPCEVWALPARSDDTCQSTRPQQQHTSCHHCLCVLEEMNMVEGARILPVQLARLLVVLYSKSRRCPLLSHWAFSVLRKAGSLLEQCFGPGHGWPASAEGIPATRGRCKRMRLDKDLMGKQVKGMVAGKRVRAAAHAQRAGLVDCDLESARSHE